jgi:uncharacterized protein (TIGR02285 family)
MLIKLRVFSLIALLNGVSCFSQAQDNIIYWQTYDSAPGFIQSGEFKGQGFVQKVLAQTIAKMPDYQHEMPLTSLARSLEDIRLGKQVCHPSLLITPERREYIHFSDYMGFNPTHRLILRRSFPAAQTPNVPINIAQHLSNRKMSFAFIKGRSFGQEIDEFIAKLNPHNRMVLLTSGNHEALFGLIANERVDAAIAYPFELGFFSKNQPAAGQSLVALEIEGVPPYIAGSVGCPKNQWGANVIVRINEILKEIKPTEEYKQALTTWWEAERQRDAFEYFYQQHFLTNK